jgi:molybdopterin converting factor small subunit
VSEIHVGVHFHAELTRFAPQQARQVRASLAAGSLVRDLLRAFKPLDQQRVVVGLNGELATLESELHDGDRVDLLTPMAGGR